jgi:hypothetical protein
MHGSTCIFWAHLTAFSLKDGDRVLLLSELGAFMVILGVEFTETELSAASNSMSALDDGPGPPGAVKRPQHFPQ